MSHLITWFFSLPSFRSNPVQQRREGSNKHH